MRPPPALAALLLAAGCGASSGSEPEFTRAPAELLIGDSYTPAIQVPSQIRPGVPAQITVTTQGGGCQKPGDTEVAFVDGAVEIRPYDFTVADLDTFCAAFLEYYPHTVSVTFPEAGPVLVRAVGEATVYDGETRRREPQTRELGVVVR